MIEILWNGRGGQGAFTAAKILGAAWALKDERNFALAFPAFGPERRGVPVRAFTKLDVRPINNRGEIKMCDFIIYLDDTLFNESVLSGLKEDGKVIINTVKRYADRRIVAVDVGHIAFGILKRPIVNTAMLGVFAAVSPCVTLPEIEHAITETMPKESAAGNIEVVRKVLESAA
jgi:pyruvate ferredoxin oxidoreductase gamma subunit